MADSILNIIINGTDNASGALSGVSSKISSLGDSVSDAGKKMTAGVTLPLVGIGAAALHMGNQFNEGMANVISLAPQAADEIAAMAPAVQDLAIQMGASTTDMTTGLYQVVSAVGLSSDTLGILEVNAMAAAAGLSSTEEAIALTSAVTKAYGDTSLEATQRVADLALGTVQMGQTTFPELAASIGRVTPLAASMGVSMNELFGVMATGTGVTGSAAEVSTQFRGILQSLMAPTESMTAAIEELGYASGQELIDIMGLEDGLHSIMRIAEESGEPLQKYIGSIEGQTLAMVLAGAQADAWGEKTQALRDGTGATAEAFLAQTQGVNAAGFAMEQAKVQVQVLGQQLGGVLAPAVLSLMPLFQRAIEFVGGLIEKFTAADPAIQTLGLVMAGLAVAAGPVMMVLGSVIGLLGALLSPIGLVVLAVGGLALAWATNFGGIRDATQPVVDAVVEFLGRIPAAFDTLVAAGQGLLQEWSGVFAQIASLVSSVFQQIGEIVRTALEIVVGSVQQNAGVIQALFLNAYTRVKDIVQGALTAIASIVQGVLGTIKQFLSTHGADIQNTLADAWLRISTIINMALEVIQLTVIPILKGIAQFIQEHSAEIQTVLSAAWTIIKNVIDGVLTVIEGIFKAALAILKGDWKGAWEIIKDTVEKVWENIRNILEAAVELMVTVIGAALTQIYDWFVKKFNEIKAFLAGFDTSELGRNIVQGLINGIMSMAGALVDAAKGVVDSAIQAARNLLGMRSPSRVFMDIGEGTMEGFVLGVLSMGQEVLNAVIDVLGDVEQEAAEQAAAIAEAMDTMLETLVAAVEAVNTLATATLPEVSIGGTVDQLLLLLTDIMDRFIAASKEFEEKGLESAKRLADAGSTIGRSISDAIGGIKAAFEFRLADMADGTDALFLALRRFVARLEYIAEIMDYQAFGAARRLAEAAGEIGSNVEAAVGGIRAAFEFRLADMADGTDALFLALRRFVARLQLTAESMDYQAFDAALRLANAAGEIGRNVLAAVDGIRAAFAFRPADMEDGTDALFLALRRFVARLQATAESMDYQAFDAALRLANAAGEIGRNLLAAIDGLRAAMEYTGGLAETTILRFYGDMMTLIEVIGQWTDNITDDWLDAAVQFAQGAGAVGREIAGSIEGLRAIMEYAGGLTETAVLRFYGDIMTLIEVIGAWTDNITDEWLEAAVAFAQGAGAVGQQIASAVEGLKGLSQYAGVADANMRRFYADMMTLIEIIGTWTDNLTEEFLERAVQFAQGIGAVGKEISSGVQGLTALMDYSGGLADTTIRRFYGDMMTLVEIIGAWTDNISSDWLEAAAQFSQAAGAIGSGIASSLEGLRGILDYVGGVTQASIDRFASDMQTLVRALVQVGQRFDADGLAAATAFASAAGTIGGAVSNTIQGLKAIMEYAGGLTQEMVDRFLVDMEILIQGVALAASRISTEAVESARTLAEAANVIGGGISSMAEALMALTDYTAPAPNKLDEFAADVYTMIEKLRIVASVLGRDAVQSALEFAQAGAAIYQAIEDGIQSVVNLNEVGALGGIPAAMDEMVQAVLNALGRMATAWVQLVNGAFNFGRDWVQAIINGINSRMGDLEALLTYIRGLFPSSPAKHGPWRTLPDGQDVGLAFTAGLAGGVYGGQGSVVDALYDLRSAFNGGMGGRGMAAGLVVNQSFEIANGDPATVREAARLGVMEAARMIGVA